MPGLDFIAYEHGHNPNDGDSVRVQDVVAEGRDVIAMAGMPAWFTEYNTNSAGTRIREQSRALLALHPQPAGIGGPI